VTSEVTLYDPFSGPVLIGVITSAAHRRSPLPRRCPMNLKTVAATAAIAAVTALILARAGVLHK
jgi:hypothetical protein